MAKMTSELNEADAGCISASAILPEKSSNSIQATVTNTSEFRAQRCVLTKYHPVNI